MAKGVGMKALQLMIVLACLGAATSLTLTFPRFTEGVEVGTTTVYAVSCFGFASDLTLTIQPQPTDTHSITPSVLSFSASQTTLNFTFISGNTPGQPLITWSLSGSSAPLYTVPSYYKSILIRQLAFVGGYATYTTPALNPIVGTATDSFALSLSTYPSSDLTVTPVSDPLGAVVFYPSTFKFTSQATLVPFYFVAKTSGPVTLNYTLSGTNADLYAPITTNIFVAKRTIVPSNAYYTAVSTVSGVNVQSSTIALSVNVAPPNGLTLTPYADNVVFTPSSLSFSSSSDTALFTYKGTKPGTSVLSWIVGGTDADWYTDLSNATLTIGLRTFTVAGAASWSMFVGQNTPTYTITTQYPPESGVTLTITATSSCNLGAAVVSQSTLSFTSSVLSQSFTVSSNALCSAVTLSAVVSGPDANNYAAPAIGGTISFKKLTLTPATVPSGGSSVYCGESLDMSLKLSSAPVAGFSVALSAPGATFTPSTLAFSPSGSLTQMFSVSSTYLQGGIQIHYQVTGADSPLLSTVSDSYFAVNSKTATAPPSSSYVTPKQSVLYTGTSSDYMSVKLSQPPTKDLTVTLRSQGITFTPSSLVFGENDMELSYKATGTTPGSFSIDYVLSGSDADCYTLSPVSASANVAKLTVQTQPISLQATTVGVWSKPVTVYVSNLASTVNLKITVLDFNGNDVSKYYNINSDTLTLTPDAPQAQFMYRALESRGSFNEYFSITADDAAHVATTTVLLPGTTLRMFNKPTRLTTAGSFPFLAAQFVAGVTSSPLLVTLNEVPMNSVSLRPSAPLTTFTPEVLTFDGAQSALSAAFTITTADGGVNLPKTITWTVEGPDAELYATPTASSFYALKRDLKVSSATTLTGSSVYVNSPISFTVATPYAPSSTLTVTPSGVGFTFSPSTITLDSSTTVAVFTATPTSMSVSAIKFAVTGNDAELYVTLPDLTVTVAKQTIQLTYPSNLSPLIYGTPSLAFKLRTPVPPQNGVTLKVYSQQVTFTKDTFEFTSTSTLAEFAVIPIPSAFPIGSTTVGVDLQFILSGPDADYFSPPGLSFATSVRQFSKLQILPDPTFYGSLTVPVVGSSQFTVYSPVPPMNSVTITPSTPADPDYVFTPASATITSTATSAVFTVVRRSSNFPRTSSVAVVLGVSGPDAYWFSDATSFTLSPFTGSITMTTTTSLTVNRQVTYQLRLNAPPVNGLVVTPYVIDGQPIQFSPSEVTFAANQTVASFSLTPTALGSSRISYRVTGNSAAAFNALDDTIVTTSAATISVSNGNSYIFNVGGQTNAITATLSSPVANSLTITPSAAGLVFSPATIMLSKGDTFFTFKATATASNLGSSVVFVFGGADAGLYTNPCPSPGTCGLISSQGSVSAYMSSTAAQFLKQTVTISLTAPAYAPLTVTPFAVNNNVTFIPSSVTFSDPSITSATIDCYAASAGFISIQYTLSGQAASYFMLQDFSASPITATFTGYTFVVSPPSSVPVGAMSGPVSLVTSAPYTTPSVVITPQANIPGVEFMPPNATVTGDAAEPLMTARFRYKSSSLSPFVISYTVTGPGAGAYAVIPSTRISTIQTSFEVPSFINNNVAPAGGFVFVYGVDSQQYTIYARAVPSEVSLQLVSESFDFTPSVLVFNQFDSSASFKMSPKKIGPAIIDFNVFGADASLFVRPTTVSGLYVTYKVTVPAAPQIPVGVPTDLVVTVDPAPMTSFVLSISGNAIISPNRLVFSPYKTLNSFTVLANTPTIGRPAGINLPGYSPQVTSSSVSLTFAGRDAADAADINIPLASAFTVIVTPAKFSIEHPRYQMDVQTKIKVAISSLPRSDVVLTLFGNNMEFETPYVIFTAGGDTEQEIVVTPKHTTSYELGYQSFKVDYYVTGTNAAEYITPVESYHYIALPMGYIAAIVLVPIAAVVIIVVIIVVLKRRGGGSGKQTSAVRKLYE